MPGTWKRGVGARVKGGYALIVGLDTTSIIRWDGTETTDIIGELNQRLAGWQAEPNPTDAA